VAWRGAFVEWYGKGKQGPQPEHDPAWMERVEGITAVGYTLKE
jgi:hypothetical protein